MISSINKQLIGTVLLVSTFATSIFTIYSYYIDYKFEENSLDKTIDGILNSTASTFSHALWEFDKKSAETQARSILNLKEVIKIRITDKEDLIFIDLAKPKEMDAERLDDDIPSTIVRFLGVADNPIAKSLTLKHPYDGYEIGVISIQITQFYMYYSLANRAMTFFISQGMKTFIVSMTLLAMFQLIVTRHLIEIARYFSRHSPENTRYDGKLELKGNIFSPKNNEFGLIVERVNGLIGRIQQHQQHLNQIVESKTQELRSIITELKNKKTELTEVFNITNLGFFFIDREGIIQGEASEPTRKFFKLPKLEDRNIFQLCKRYVSQVDHDKLKNALIDLVNDRKSSNFQVQHFEIDVIRSGKRKRMDIAIQPTLTHDINLSGKYLVTIRDVSMKHKVKQMEENASKAVHQSLFPQKNYFNGFECYTYYQSADALGGDWYHFWQDQRYPHSYFIIGDVTGHGLPSSLAASTIGGAFQAMMIDLLDSDRDIPSNLIHLFEVFNKVIYGTNRGSGHMMTMTVICVDHINRKAYYLNAGHVPVIQFTKNGVISHGVASSPLGLVESPSFGNKEFDIAIGDQILMFTDGLLESSSSKQKIRKREIIKLFSLQESAAKNCKKIEKLIAKYHQGKVEVDDCTILNIKITHLEKESTNAS